MEHVNVSSSYNALTTEHSLSISYSSHISTNQALFLMCILGTPGNVFVAAVYIRKMTTSIRAYLFALSVVDTAICVCFITLINGHLGNTSAVALIVVFNSSLIFSTTLLAFLAAERCMAVARPHKFTITITRAKRALAAIAAMSGCFTATLSATLAVGFNRMYAILGTAYVNVAFVIMITSYGVMAVILLKRTKAARRQVGIVMITPRSRDALDVSTSTSSQTAATSEVVVLQSSSCTTRKDTAVGPPLTYPKKDVHIQRDTLVLFVVTAVFILCWLPFFLKNYGLSIPDDVRRVYTINSVVNPFIYSFVSPMFRSDVRQFYRDIRARLTTCC